MTKKRDDGDDCLACRGSGERPCSTCGGSGIMETREGPYVTCPVCSGSGKVPCPYC